MSKRKTVSQLAVIVFHQKNEEPTEICFAADMWLRTAKWEVRNNTCLKGKVDCSSITRTISLVVNLRVERWSRLPSLDKIYFDPAVIFQSQFYMSQRCLMERHSLARSRDLLKLPLLIYRSLRRCIPALLRLSRAQRRFVS